MFETTDTTTARIYVGGPIDIEGGRQVTKAISKPVATGPASYQTRVGNIDSVSLLIKTTTGGAAIKKFRFTQN